MFSLAYDPQTMTAEEATGIASGLGIGHVREVPGAWHVERRSFDGWVDIGRPSRDTLKRLPELEPHPAQVVASMLAELGDTDATEMQENIASLVALFSADLTDAEATLAHVLLDTLRYVARGA